MDRLNTGLTAIAAIAAVVGTVIGIWQLGSDNRKVVSFRNTCRSEIGAIQDRLDQTRKLNVADTTKRAIEGLQWSALDARLNALQATSPIIASGDTQLLDGIAEVRRLAEIWANQKDLWQNSLDQKTFDAEVEEMTKASMPIVYDAAGKIR